MPGKLLAASRCILSDLYNAYYAVFGGAVLSNNDQPATTALGVGFRKEVTDKQSKILLREEFKVDQSLVGSRDYPDYGRPDRAFRRIGHGHVGGQDVQRCIDFGFSNSPRPGMLNDSDWTA